MTTMTRTYGDNNYEVEQTDDERPMINLTLFSKTYQDIQPKKFPKAGLKAWINLKIKGTVGLYRQGETNRTHLVDDSIWVLWMTESLGATASAGSKQGGFDEENRSWISGLFAEWKSTVREWFSRHETLAAQHGARITRTEDKIEKILSWQYEHGEMLKNKGDTGRVAELERKYQDLVQENRTLKVRITALEDNGNGSQGKKKSGWF